MKLIGTVVLAFILVSGGVSAKLSDELAHLESLATQEVQLVEAARRFDLQQKSLIQWDGDLIRQYGAQGRSDLIRTKQNDTNRRIELIRETWEFVTDRYPNNARALNYFGEYLYDYGGEKLKAIRNWRVAIQLDKKLAAPHNNLGLHDFHQGNYKTGLEHLQRALELEKNNPDFLYNMSQMYMLYFPQIGAMLDTSKDKLYREAMRMSKKAAELLPDDHHVLLDYATNFYAAEGFGIQADWQTAAMAWRKVSAKAETHQEYFFAYLNEGRTWLWAGKSDKAIEALKQASILEPDSRVVAQLLQKARKGKG